MGVFCVPLWIETAAGARLSSEPRKPVGLCQCLIGKLGKRIQQTSPGSVGGPYRLSKVKGSQVDLGRSAPSGVGLAPQTGQPSPLRAGESARAVWERARSEWIRVVPGYNLKVPASRGASGAEGATPSSDRVGWVPNGKLPG